MTFDIPFCFLNQTVTLSWADIRYAMPHNWISPSAAVDFAKYRLASPLEEVHPEELEFIRAQNDFEIVDLVDALASREVAHEEKLHGPL